MAESTELATPDPNEARREAKLAAFRQMDTAALQEAYIGAYARVAKLLMQAAPMQEDMRLIERVVADLMLGKNIRELPSTNPGLRFIVEEGKPSDDRDNEKLLRKLRALRINGAPIPQARIAECVYEEPPKPPKLLSHKPHLKNLIKDYGDDVAAIVKECLTSAPGAKSLKVAIDPEKLT